MLKMDQGPLRPTETKKQWQNFTGHVTPNRTDAPENTAYDLEMLHI